MTMTYGPSVAVGEMYMPQEFGTTADTAGQISFFNIHMKQVGQ